MNMQINDSAVEASIKTLIEKAKSLVDWNEASDDLKDSLIPDNAEGFELYFSGDATGDSIFSTNEFDTVDHLAVVISKTVRDRITAIQAFIAADRTSRAEAGLSWENEINEVRMDFGGFEVSTDYEGKARGGQLCIREHDVYFTFRNDYSGTQYEMLLGLESKVPSELSEVCEYLLGGGDSSDFWDIFKELDTLTAVPKEAA